jgi:ribosomal protein L11 methyltransferase
MPWLAVTLELEAAAAEALSDALLEEGAASTSIDHPTAPRVALTALFSLQAPVDAALAAAAARCGLAAVPAYALARVEDEDWVRRSQSQFSPLRIGRLWIGAGWHAPEAGCTVVRLDPGMAFGTGSHPTTQLVLRFVERAVTGGERVLDYGCGSGILAIAAAKLGAARVDATDIDPLAVETAAANARRNQVELGLCAPEELGSGLYDIVLANILSQPLIVLAPLLAARTAAGGRIALAGVLESQADEVAAAYAQWFAVTVPARQEGWALLEGVKQ